MRLTTTNGQVYSYPDVCAYCQLDTAGNHESHCPCANPEFYTDVETQPVTVTVDYDKE